MTARRTDADEGRRQARGGAVEPTRAHLLTMVLGTFREMPGLSLHLNQAARLFGVRSETCKLLLDDLVTEGRLRRSPDGQYLGAELRRVSLSNSQPPTPPPSRA